jgi:hypothetical protein
MTYGLKIKVKTDTVPLQIWQNLRYDSRYRYLVVRYSFFLTIVLPYI